MSSFPALVFHTLEPSLVSIVRNVSKNGLQVALKRRFQLLRISHSSASWETQLSLEAGTSQAFPTIKFQAKMVFLQHKLSVSHSALTLSSKQTNGSRTWRRKTNSHSSSSVLPLSSEKSLLPSKTDDLALLRMLRRQLIPLLTPFC